MKFRASIVLEFELTEQQAMERHGTIDKYALAALMSQDAQREAEEMARDKPGVESAHARVEPIPW